MSELGDLLALLHDAPGRVRRLRAEIITRTDPKAAARAWARQGASSGGRVMMYAYASEEEDAAFPAETCTRIWVDLDERLEREQNTGGHERLAVRRGETWWSWDPHCGAMSNEDEEGGTSVGDDRKWILGGLRVLASLRIEPLGPGEVARRPTVRCRATPHRAESDEAREWALHDLPAYGSDAYELDVDRELGLILRVAGSFAGEVFSETEVVELGVDENFPDDLFTFASPDGSPVRSISDLHGHHHHDLRPDRLLELADFKVFVPRRTPEHWETSLGFSEPSARPLVRPSATLSLRSPDNLRTVRITQIPVDGEGEYDEWDHAGPAPWRETSHDGIQIQWRDPVEDWQPARVRLDRDGTRILIDSPDLPAKSLLDLATNLVELGSERPDFGSG